MPFILFAELPDIVYGNWDPRLEVPDAVLLW